jgi:hypothetical protein
MLRLLIGYGRILEFQRGSVLKLAELQLYAKNRTINVAKNQVKITYKQKNYGGKAPSLKYQAGWRLSGRCFKGKCNSQKWKKYC